MEYLYVGRLLFLKDIMCVKFSQNNEKNENICVEQSNVFLFKQYKSTFCKYLIKLLQIY